MTASTLALGRRLVMIVGTAAISFTQPAVRFRGPDSGLLYDPPTQSIRSINGLIGAAQLANAVVDGVEWGSVAPSGKLALFKKGGNLLALVVQAVPATDVVGQADAPDEVLWAADSQSATLVWTTTKTVQRIAVGTNGTVTSDVKRELSLDGEIRSVGAGAAGTLVVAVAGRGVYVVELQKMTSRLLLPLPECRAILTSTDESALFAIDGERGILYRISFGEEQPTVVSADTDRLAGVTRMANSTNGRGLLLANSETRRIYQLNGGDQAVEELAVLEAPVTLLRPIGRSSLYLLGHRTSGAESVQFYDDLRGDTVFVPLQGGNQ